MGRKDQAPFRDPVSVGDRREDPDRRYTSTKWHPGRKGQKRVVEVTFIGVDEKASVVDTFSGRLSKISVSTLERWKVVT